MQQAGHGLSHNAHFHHYGDFYRDEHGDIYANNLAANSRLT